MARYFRRARILTSELFRQAAVSEFMAHCLRAWAAADDRVAHVRFEELCRDPLGETTQLFEFLGLEYDDRSLAAIRRMTTGSSDEYYATDKDSQHILDQPYKYLGGRDLIHLTSFLGRD